MNSQNRSSDSIATYTWSPDDYSYPNPGLKNINVLYGFFYVGLGVLFVQWFGLIKLCLFSVFLILPGAIFLSGLALSIAGGDSSEPGSKREKTILAVLFSPLVLLWNLASKRPFWISSVLISLAFLVMGILWQ